MSKSLRIALLIFIAVVVAGWVNNNQVDAADTAVVSATVTVQNVSVTVSPGTVAYGTMALNSSKSTIPADLNAAQTVTNNGNVSEQFNIRGQNSANWTLGLTAGSDTYVHQFCAAACTSPPTNFTGLTTNYQTLAASIAASGTQTLHLRLTTPTTSSVFTQQSVDVTLQAVAI